MSKIIGIIAALMLLVFGLSACDMSDGSSGETTDQKSGQANQNKLVKQEPALNMDYSSTRATINFFTKTWGVKGKTAYVYLMNNEGNVIGYYVTEGPPVSMCVSIRPTYKLKDVEGDGFGPSLVVPAAGADGAYYSGGECNTYYAKDANTGAYIQYTAGQGINPLLFDQPLSPGIVKDAPNLGTVVAP